MVGAILLIVDATKEAYSYEFSLDIKGGGGNLTSLAFNGMLQLLFSWCVWYCNSFYGYNFKKLFYKKYF
jgi:hypothetical protein